MVLHPTIKEILQVSKQAQNLPLSQTPLQEIRKSPMRIKRLMGAPTPIENVVNHSIKTYPDHLLLRLYYPKGDTPLPLILYFHPGGFVKGDVDTHDPIYRTIAKHSGCIVAALNYSLAPEHPFPTALSEAKTALHWIVLHQDEIGSDGRIAVGGEEVGGNLAAVLSQEIRDEGLLKLSFQLLICPQTDFTCTTLSHEKFHTGYLLERTSIDWYKEQYLGEKDSVEDPRISPLLASGFSSLPPAFILTAELDPLRDDGEAYAQKLKEAGVAVKHHRYEGMVHGFFQMGGVLDVARLAHQEVGKALQTHFQING